MTDRLTGKVAVVTGAGRGLGAGIAAGLAREGARVVVADINGDAAQETADAISADGGTTVAVQVDVTDRSAVKLTVEAAVEHFEHLDVWFNNAGLNIPLPFLDVTEDNWRTILDVNALGVLIGTQEAARQMIIQQRPGKIVNTASIAGRQGFASFAPYSASKFAVIGLTQAGARALAAHRITVNAFSPGVVATPLWKQLDKDLVEIGDASEVGEAFASFASGALLGRAAEVADIVPTAIFLASADSDFITGQVVAIDGGMVLV
jgi:meso-butanediol dehydrogenase/(S,S)-butanediol dehydrogenase/diacetyl reductase